MVPIRFDQVPRSLFQVLQDKATEAGIGMEGDDGTTRFRGHTIRYTYYESSSELEVQVEGWLESMAAEELRRQFAAAREEWRQTP